MAPREGSSRLLAAFAYLLLLCRAGAVEYVVGDGDFGWDSGVNYATWAQKYTFGVGDVLVFQYVSSQHNVYEVTASTYRSCDATGVLAKYTSGFDKVALAEARSYWFICDFPGHCLGGMKLAVNVSANGAAGGGEEGGAPSPTATNEPPELDGGDGVGSSQRPDRIDELGHMNDGYVLSSWTDFWARNVLVVTFPSVVSLIDSL